MNESNAMAAGIDTVTQFSLTVDRGPEDAATARPGRGAVTLSPTRYSAPPSPRRPVESTLRSVDHVVEPGDRLSYQVFPAFRADYEEVPDAPGWQGLGFASTGASIDLVFDDGTRLSAGGTAVDQHGIRLGAEAQGASRILAVQQWNLIVVDLAEHVGKRVSEIVVLAETCAGQEILGWIDDVTIARPAERPRPQRPSDWVVTTRGTNSSPQLSRGNTVPAVSMPNGFSFVTPVTDARDGSFMYLYQLHNDDRNRPRLEAFAVCHLPTPWLGDHHVLHLFPSRGRERPSGSARDRGQTFARHEEWAGPHRYRTLFDSGVSVSATTTERVAVFEMRWPVADPSIILDQLDDEGLVVLPSQPAAPHEIAVTGYSDYRGAEVSAGSRMFFAVSIDHPVIESGSLADAEHPHTSGFVRVRAEADEPVTLRVATSFIGLEQAIRTLDLETTAGDTVETVSERTQQAWDARLGAVEVSGASDDQLTTLYSNLYRLFLYPNAAHENGGTAEAPRWIHASPLVTPVAAHTATHSGSVVREGELFVNNGFWDTYRTAWPAYHLLQPELSAELLDGFVEHFREAGWMARWSAPGFLDCMVGTSSDVILADAAAKGVPLRAVQDAYDSALKNATVPSTDPRVGRKGLADGIFRGYISTATPEGLSWTMESALNDFGIAEFSDQLAASADLLDPRLAEYRANAVYFRDRASSYASLFDPATGFFRGRDESGEFIEREGGFDPRVWGFDYTETNAWGMAFMAPHDVAALAELYGGPDEFERHLDAFFTTPELGLPATQGGYGMIIHEMTEGRNVRMGMWAFSNQPAHHVPFLYAHTRSPHKTQRIVREALSRLFVGSEIGQGYPGDEDNGEMSAWYVFAALGFYPLAVGSAEYVLCAPLFESARVRVGAGAELSIVCHGQSPENVYIQRVTVDGGDWDSPFIDHATLTSGCTLEFHLGPEPSEWGRSSAVGHRAPSADRPRRSDLSAGRPSTTSDGRDASCLTDDRGDAAVLVEPGWWFQIDGAAASGAAYYTLTCGGDPSRAPRAWSLLASADGDEWVTIDRRHDESFRWPRQTRPFLLEPADGHPAAGPHYRLLIEGMAPVELTQLELYAPDFPE